MRSKKLFICVLFLIILAGSLVACAKGESVQKGVYQ